MRRTAGQRLQWHALVMAVLSLVAAAAEAGQWAATYGGARDDTAGGVSQTADGGLIVSGNTTSFAPAPSSYAWLLKLDASGRVLWQKTYGAPGGTSFGATPTSDGGYIGAGSSNAFGAGLYSGLVVKLDAAGDVVWQKAYGGGQGDFLHSLVPISDAGYIVAGESYSFRTGGSDAWVLKLDAVGDVVWQKHYGGSGSDYFSAVRPTADGGYVAAGSTDSFGPGGSRAWVVKLDASGNVTWQKIYGSTENTAPLPGDVASDVQPTPDGGFVVAGVALLTLSPRIDLDAWVLKLNADGEVVWQKTYGGTNSDGAYSVIPTRDGYIVLGYTSSFGDAALNGDAWLLKLDPNGNIVWQKTFGGPQYDDARGLGLTADGGYVGSGFTTSFGAGDFNTWVIKLDANGDIGSGCIAMRPTSAVPANRVTLVQNTTATVADSNAVPIATTLASAVSAAATVPLCLSADAAQVPAISEWRLIAALGFLVLGVAAMTSRGTFRRQ